MQGVHFTNPERIYFVEKSTCKLQVLFSGASVHNVSKQTHKKLVATASRCEGVYNRAGEPSVTFCERGEARKRADDFFA